MANNVQVFTLDAVTPYGVAAANGYTGTRQEYNTLLANLPQAAGNAATSAAAAAESAAAAALSAGAIDGALADAGSYASAALQAAQQAALAATNAQLAAIAASRGLDVVADRWLASFAESIATIVLNKLPNVEGGSY